ncbi:hypothetical protein B0H10DRAFT_1969895 [Mycena sp. CBHHK59/15]|nr:hypothetical protein B0H10DRAFT_1969895 [Mycena sp. CBHHK59/15]
MAPISSSRNCLRKKIAAPNRPATQSPISTAGVRPPGSEYLEVYGSIGARSVWEHRGSPSQEKSDFSAHPLDPCIRFHLSPPKAVQIEEPHLLDPPFLMSPDTPKSTHPFSNGTRNPAVGWESRGCGVNFCTAGMSRAGNADDMPKDTTDLRCCTRRSPLRLPRAAPLRRPLFRSYADQLLIPAQLPRKFWEARQLPVPI